MSGKISGPLGSLVELRITRPPSPIGVDNGAEEVQAERDEVQAERDRVPESFTVLVPREIPIQQLNPTAPATPDREAKASKGSKSGAGPQEEVGGGDDDAEGMLRQWMAEVKQAPKSSQANSETREIQSKRESKCLNGETTRPAPPPKRKTVAGTLAVRCVGAVGLPKMDTFTQKADPYLVVKVADTEHKTSVKKKTLEPVWDETLSFQCVAGMSVLRVEMYDHEAVGKDRSMGSFSVPITANMQLNKHFPLEGTLTDKRSATGMVELALVFQPSPNVESESDSALAKSRDLHSLPVTGEPNQGVGKGGPEADNALVKTPRTAMALREKGKLSAAEEVLSPLSPPKEQIEDFWKEQESKRSSPTPRTSPQVAAKAKINRDSTSSTWSKRSPTDVTDTTRDFSATDAELLEMVAMEDRKTSARRIVKSRHTIPWEECPAHISSQGLISLHKRSSADGVCVCVCVCVREREREREPFKRGERLRERRVRKGVFSHENVFPY